MLKSKFGILLTLIFTLFSISAVQAQINADYEPIAASSVTGAKLPANALQVKPSSVPAEINQGLEKIVEASEGKLTSGESEVLAWSENGYTKAKAPGLIAQLEKNLSAAGWKYEVGGAEGEVTFFTILRETPKRRAVVGYFVASDEGLVVAWMEVFQANKNAVPAENEAKIITDDSAEKIPAKTQSGNLRDLVGKWERKQSGMSSYTNGNYQGSSGNYESYTFYADGRVDYTMLVAVQNYGCRLEAFSTSKGRAGVSGAELKVNLGAGTIRRDDSRSPNKNYTKPTEASDFTYGWTVEKDEYGTTQLVLTESNGSKYYYRRAQ